VKRYDALTEALHKVSFLDKESEAADKALVKLEGFFKEIEVEFLSS
jgi:hypothetical protein